MESLDFWDFNLITVQKASCGKRSCEYSWGRLMPCFHLVTFKETNELERMSSSAICNFLYKNGEKDKIPKHLAFRHIFPENTDITKNDNTEKKEDENKLNETIIKKQREEIKQNYEKINKQLKEIKMNNEKLIELTKASSRLEKLKSSLTLNK
jgi:hypothetical protein